MTAWRARVFWIFIGLTVVNGPSQAFPERSLTLILPYAATGTPDMEGTPRMTKMVKLVQSLSTPSLADLLAQGAAAGLGAVLDQTVQIERRPGNRGMDGMHRASSAAADGHTLLFAAVPVIGEDEIAIEANRPLRNFDAVAVIAQMPMAFVVEERPQGLPLRDLLAQAGRNPARIALATLGPSTSSVFASDRLQRAASISFLTVEYNGAAAALNAVATRNVDAAMVPLPLALPHVGGGKLKIVAVTSSMRHPAIPLVSTMAEAAISGFSAEGGFGLFTTKGVPAKTLEILRRAADSVVAEGSWKRLLIVRGMLPPAPRSVP